LPVSLAISLVQQDLALALGLVVVEVSEGVGLDLAVHEPGLPP
jgi:hypothetical protein